MATASRITPNGSPIQLTPLRCRGEHLDRQVAHLPRFGACHTERPRTFRVDFSSGLPGATRPRLCNPGGPLTEIQRQPLPNTQWLQSH